MPKYLKLITWLAVAGGGVLALVTGMGNPSLSILGIIMFIGGLYEAAGACDEYRNPEKELLRRRTLEDLEEPEIFTCNMCGQMRSVAYFTLQGGVTSEDDENWCDECYE